MHLFDGSRGLSRPQGFSRDIPSCYKYALLPNRRLLRNKIPPSRHNITSYGPSQACTPAYLVCSTQSASRNGDLMLRSPHLPALYQIELMNNPTFTPLSHTSDCSALALCACPFQTVNRHALLLVNSLFCICFKVFTLLISCFETGRLTE